MLDADGTEVTAAARPIVTNIAKSANAWTASTSPVQEAKCARNLFGRVMATAMMVRETIPAIFAHTACTCLQRNQAY